ncbi:MAG: hydrogenobyrinic acid a,c-diamide synthase (glutamine-hydrolyzing) [Nitrospinae bacterium]|nr:hydrogenobyrinic acid a,c-diamide synthase (glutamine-hydrolyzing) [Nitrospinota bacterium]
MSFNNNFSAPRIVISAPHGRSGKTTVSIGLSAALSRRGLKVQPFKKGPDYIDTGWLTIASKNQCRNLDLFLMEEKGVKNLFKMANHDADISIIEGNTGLYDSIDIEGKNSTANLARILNAPVILVVDTARMTRSIAALINGYVNFEPDIKISGVILNNVSGQRHEAKLRAAIAKYSNVEVLGCIPRNPLLNIPERHLGLIPQIEKSEFIPAIEKISSIVEANVNIDRIIEISKNVSSIQPSAFSLQPPTSKSGIKIGVVMDRAFSFYYPENFEALKNTGAEIVFFNTLEDRFLPDVDALYIGGGFPEMFADELENNESICRDMKNAVEDGMPVYAECGGLMYLSRSITWNGKTRKMVGAIPCDTEMTKRLQAHGYVILQDKNNGSEIRGHEFHYSRVRNLGNVSFLYNVIRGKGIDGRHDGIVYKNVIASYSHIHTMGAQLWAEDFMDRIVNHKQGYKYKIAV